LALLRIDVSEERLASIIRVTRICELRITLVVTSNGSIQRRSISISINISSYGGDYEEDRLSMREKWVVVRDTTGGGGDNLSSVLKVPRHCPFVLLVSVSF
jgi:hypothetical protein